MMKLTREKVVELRKKWLKHRKWCDEEGNFACPISEVNGREIASKEEWMGSEEARLRSILELRKEREMVSCETCDVFTDFISYLSGKPIKTSPIRVKGYKIMAEHFI